LCIICVNADVIFRKLRKIKIQIDWQTACEGLTEFEKNFANNSPDFKCLVENVHLLTLHTALVKRANYELNAIFHACNRQIKEKVKELQELLFNKIIEDSGVGISISNLNSIVSSNSTTESSEEEILEF
jgi:undecaprenyl pyrophosphate synthase